MRILFSNHFCAIPKYGKSSRTFSLARELVHLGHEVSIVTSSISHSRDTQPDVCNTIETEMVSGVRLIYLKTPAYTTGNKAARLRNIAGFIIRYRQHSSEIVRMITPDIIIEGNAYTLPFIVSSRIARHARAKLVLEVRDLWPLTLFELGVSRWNPGAWMIGKVQAWALKRSDLLVSSLRFADRYFDETGRSPKAFAYLPNSADQALFAERQPVSHNVLWKIAELRARYPNLVGYAGSIGIANSVDRLIDAINDLAPEGVGVVVIGSGARKAELSSVVTKRGQDNVLFLDPVPKAQVFEVLETFDLGFVGGRARVIHGYGVSPNKLYDYMICKVPVLFCLATQDNIVAEADAGISVPDPAPENIISAVKKFFLLSPRRRTEMGKNGHQAIMAQYTYDKVAKEYLKRITALCEADKMKL